MEEHDVFVGAFSSVENCQKRAFHFDDEKDQAVLEQIDIGVVRDGRNGRPPYSVSMELMESLIEDEYTSDQLKDMLGVCKQL